MSMRTMPRTVLALTVLLVAGCSSSPVSQEHLASRDAASVLRSTPVQGFIELPVAGPTPAVELTILTAAASAPVEVDGTFSVAAAGTEKQQLVIVENGQGRAFALAYGRQKETEPLRISARSTGLSLVMLNPMFVYASDDQRDSLMAVARKHQDFNDLEGLVFKAWKENPGDPLEPELHPEMYELAAQIAHDVINETSAFGSALFRGRKEPVIRDRPGTEIRFENDMCVHFGAGIRPASGGSTEGVAVWSKDTAITLRWCWCWPPWVETSPTDTDHDLGYGRFVVEISKGFHGSWSGLDMDTAPGVGSVWNLTKGIVLTMDLLAGLSSAGDSDSAPALTISADLANGLQTAMTEQDTWSTAKFVFDIIMANADDIAYWFYQDATTDARRQFVTQAHGAMKRVASVAAWVQLGWDAGNRALPYFYDLIDATSSRSYYLIHDANGLVVTENFPPEKPDPPVGPSNVWTGRLTSYRASTVDPDDEDISYRFHWGAEEESPWSDFLASGDTVLVEHRFPAPGIVDVTVDAMDTTGIASAESDPLRVRVRNLPVLVDVIPLRFPNAVRQHNGVEWVHVVGTDTLDVRQIDPATITLSVVLPSEPPVVARKSGDDPMVLHPRRWRIGDMNAPNAIDGQRHRPGVVKDGIDDLILAFDNGELFRLLVPGGDGEQMVRILGRLADGTVIEGSGIVVMTRRGVHEDH